MSELTLPSNNQNNMSISSHIVVLAFPFGTHAAPLLNLARRLAFAAPHLSFSFFSTSQSISSIFSGPGDFHNIKAYSVWNGMADQNVQAGNFHEAIGIFLKAAPGNYEKAMEEAEKETGKKISCLLTDAFLWFSCDLAEKYGVPWIPYWTAASCSLSVHIYTDVIRSKITDLSEKAEQTLAFLPGLEAIHITDLPEEVVAKENNHQSPISHLLHNMGLKLPKATSVVLNSFEEIDPVITNDLKSKLKIVFNIGPSTLSPTSSSSSNECLQWLDKQNHGSVVYISFGTITTPPPDEMVELAEALEAMKVPFLWSLRDHSRKLLPTNYHFLDDGSKFGKFVSWAPQLQVLEHSSVGAFVTHCGWNSILESISFGVPLICRPFFGDQNLNSVMIEDVWKIGVRIKGGVFTKDGLINALNLVLSGDQGNEIRDNVRILKEKALDATKPNGSSSRNFEALLNLIMSPI